MPLFQWGDFILNSGLGTWWRIDCDAFTDSEIQLFAKLIAEKVGDFTSVSCPRSHPGSMPPKLVEALKPYAKASSQLKKTIMLVVDDVATTGNSINALMNKHRPYYDEVIGACVFTRNFEAAKNIYALFLGNF